MNYTPPNPYSGFFNFGDPASMSQQSFVPNPSGTLSPGTLSAMGQPSGGFNPSLAEFMAARNRDVATQQFIARSLGSDPTTRTFSNMAMELLAKDKMTRDTMVQRYGQSNIDQAVGFALSMPSISGFMGGSARSLSIGALAAGSSGMRWNGMGMIGDGQVQLNSAQRILEMVRGSFYTGSGAQKLDMTQGLNKDQLGAILAAGGAQGAFAGLDMGSINKMGHMNFNEGSLSRIKDFTKNAAKAISSLIDIYGDANFNELFDKAQRITGMDFSRMGNAGIMQNRLEGLRNTARVSGMDTQTMFDLSAGLVNYGVASGFSRSAAGAIASTVQGQAAWQYQMDRQSAGAFYSPTRGLGDIAASLGRDRFGMVRDPLGARRSAVELMIQDNLIQGADIAQARAMSQVGAGSTPGAAAARLDAWTGAHGINMANFIRSRGGAMGVFEQLSDTNKAFASDQNSADLNSRFGRILGANTRMMLRDMGPAALGQYGNLMNIVTTLGANNAIELMTAAGNGGSSAALSKIVGGTILGQDAGTRDSLVNSALGLQSVFGSRTLGVYNSTLRIKKASGLANNLMTTEEKALYNVQAFHSLGGMGSDTFGRLQADLGGINRGQFKGTILQGILDRAGGTDPSSILAMAVGTEEGRRNLVGANKIGDNWVLHGWDLSADNLGGANGVSTLERFREAMRRTGAEGIADLTSAGLIVDGHDVRITSAIAAKFAGRYATDPGSMFPHFSAIGLGGRNESFLTKSFGKRMRDYGGFIGTMGRIHEYLNDPARNKGFFATTEDQRARQAVDKSLLTLRRLTMDPTKEFGDLDPYDLLTGGALLSVLPPEATAEFARQDAKFAKAVHDQNLDPRIKEAMRQFGASSAGSDYMLTGGFTLPDGSMIDLGNVGMKAKPR